MLRYGQAPVSGSSEMLDVLSMLIARQSPGAGAGGGGAGGAGDAGAGSGAGAGGGGAGGAGNDDDPTTWDKERAARTITSQRAREKALSDELKTAQAERDTLATRVKAIEDKDKSAGEKAVSDLEAANKKLAQAEQRATEAEQRHQASVIRAAIDREAHAAGAVDPDAVAALLDRSGIAVGEDGTVTGADKAVAALLKAKPYLVRAEGSGTRSVPATGKPGTSSVTREEDVEKRAKILKDSGTYSRF